MITPPIPNPFPFTTPASGRDFYGRQEVLGRIFYAAQAGLSIGITGARYMGKSSLLAHVETPETQRAHGLDPDRWIFGRIKCSKISTGAQLSEAAVHIIRRSMGLRRHNLSPTAQAALHKPEQRKMYGLPEAADLRALTQVARALRARNGGLVFLLDDFEALLTLPEAHILTDLLGLAAGGVPLILAFDRPIEEIMANPDFGDPKATQRFRTYHHSAFESLAGALNENIEMGPLSDAEAQAILESGFVEAGLTLHPEDAEIILALGGGHPVLLQTAAFLCFDLIASSSSHRLPSQAVDQVAEAGRAYLSSLWHALPANAQRYAYLVAQRGIEEARATSPQPEAEAALSRHHVLKMGDPPTFFSPLFKRFVIERLPIPAPPAPETTKTRVLPQSQSPGRSVRLSYRTGWWTNKGVVPGAQDSNTSAGTRAQGEHKKGGKARSTAPWLNLGLPEENEEAEETDRRIFTALGSGPAPKATSAIERLREVIASPRPGPSPQAPPPPATQPMPVGPPQAGSSVEAGAAPTPPARRHSPWAMRISIVLSLMIATVLVWTLWLGDQAADAPARAAGREGAEPLKPPDDFTALSILVLIGAPLMGYGLGSLLGMTVPRPGRAPLPEDEAAALTSLTRGVTDAFTDKSWATALLEMASANTLDGIADARWTVDSIELAQAEVDGIFELAEPKALALRTLAEVTQECSAAVRAAYGSARSIHLARSLAHLESLDGPTGRLDPGPIRDGIWLVGRVWRRILVDAVEGSVGHPQLSATLLTPQVRYDETVTIALEVANKGDASAMEVEVALMPPTGAAISGASRVSVGDLAPDLSIRVRFCITPHRREPIYLTFQVQHHDPLRGGQILQLNERLAFVDLTGRFRPVDPIPYITGKPVEPGQVFVGRQKDLSFVEEAILKSQTPPTIMVIGRRRMGKTSLLRHIPLHLGDRALCVQLDFQARPTDELVELMSWVTARLRAQHPDGRLPTVSKAEFEVDPGDALTRLGVDPLLRAAGPRPVVLLIDEVESLYGPMEEGKLSRRFFENIRALIQHRPQVALVLAGTYRLAARSASSQSVLFGAALTRELSFLDRRDVAQLMREPLAPFGIEVAPLAIDRVHHLAGGHPLLSQHLCYHLVRRLNRLEVGFVTSEDVDATLPDASEGAQEHLRLWWNEASGAERWLLVSLAKLGSKPRQAAEVQRQLERFGWRAPLAVVRRHLQSLVAREILIEHGDTFSVAHRQELFRRFVEETYANQEARGELVPWDQAVQESGS